MAVDAQSGCLLDGSHSAARGWLAGAGRSAWRRFFLAILALALALFLALYATALSQLGRYGLAAGAATFSLLLTTLVAIRVIPRLAKRTALRRWMAKIDYQFTREGAVYLAMIVIIAVAALNTGNNLLFIILSCLLAAILASGVLSGIVLQGLELDLGLPDHIFAGQTILARLRLQNRKQFFPTFSVTFSGQADSRRKRRKPAAKSGPAILARSLYIPYLPRRASLTHNVKLTFPRRGRYLQESLRVSTRFPFGFVRKTRTIPCAHQALVLPAVQPTQKFLEVLPLIGSEMDSYLKGRGNDLYAIRDYQQSDSARHVDWKASARVGQLKVREFTREDERRLRLVFDARVPDARPETLQRFEKAVTLCACLAWYFSETQAVISFATEGFETPMSPANQVLYPVLEKLALIEPVVAGGHDFFADSSRHAPYFQVIVTYQPRESVPAGLQRSSYFVWMDSL